MSKGSKTKENTIIIQRWIFLIKKIRKKWKEIFPDRNTTYVVSYKQRCTVVENPRGVLGGGFGKFILLGLLGVAR
jgi:hypothetical protein